MKKNLKSQAVVKRKTYDNYLITKKNLVANLKKNNIYSAEVKHLTFSWTPGQIDSTTGYIGSIMAALTLGDSATDRIGNTVQLKGLFYNGRSSYAGTTASLQGVLDIILDRAPSGALAVITDIYTSGEPTQEILFSSRKRFKLIKRIFFSMGTYATWQDGPAMYNGYIDFKKYKTQWSAGAAGTISDLKNGKNDVLITFRSSQPSAGNLSYSPTLNTRMLFTDA